MNGEDRRSLIAALEEFAGPLPDIEAGFDYDGENARRRGLTALAADLHRFSAAAKEIRKRAEHAIRELRSHAARVANDDDGEAQPLFAAGPLTVPD